MNLNTDASRIMSGAPLPASPVMASVLCGDQQGGAQLFEELGGTDPALVLLFSSAREDLTRLSSELSQKFGPDCPVVGCTSAGEIGPDGYATGTVIALAFPRASFRAAICTLANQEHIPVSQWMAQLRRFRTHFNPDSSRSVFGILFADGQARHEDVLVATLEAALPVVPVIGGSAADGLRFGRTTQVVNGEEYPGSAIFVLVETDLAVTDVSFAHFIPTSSLVVVTKADPLNRTILELNAESAVQEYMRLTGLTRDRLTPQEFARHPLILRTGRRNHIRAIRGVTPEGGLELMSAIENGTILRLGRVEDMTQGFADTLQSLPRPPLMVLGFDCILRRLALERAGMIEEMSRILTRFRVAGFNTYGEQQNGMHVNQTFVGLAFTMPETL